MSDDNDAPERVSILHKCDDHALIGREDGTVKLLQPMQEGSHIPPGTRIVGFEDHGEPGYATMKTLCRTPGPAKVNSRQYKSGWDTVFGKKSSPKPKDVN